ncbi:MAG TPA: alpha/beta hydrolase [Acidobacteriota bacterium]|nr:alpha/beta hydrolase [Acidobacteriota bacterium]
MSIGDTAEMEPISQYYHSHRLKLHFWDWGDNGKPNLILVHGSRDHARNWDLVAEAFANNFRVLAPDLRGHGDSGWATGAMYSIPEYVLDLSALIDIVGRWPVFLIGHSLGGAIVLQYAGIYPDRVRKLVSIEGYGPPPERLRRRPAHERLREWIESMRQYEIRVPRKYPTLEAAIHRMLEANPYLTAETARRLTLFGSNWNPDGSLTWKFDNYVRALSPYGFNMEDAQEIWRQIRCPALLFRGLDSWAIDPEKDGRIHAIPNYRLINVPKAGHWVHHDQPVVFIEETRRFFEEPDL